MSETVKIFIGSGEASVLERKVLIYSLRKHSQSPLDIHVFNGTHDTVERQGEPPVPLRVPLDIKYQNFTEFSNYRFLIPSLCNWMGRAIWLDSDTVCLSDIAELFATPMGGHALLAKRDAYGSANEARWGLSVALIDCAQCPFDLLHFDEIRRNLYTYNDLHQLTPRFLNTHPMSVGALDPNWNVFDRYDRDTKLIHYTNLRMQPWKYRGHPYGDIWFRYFNEARRAGFVTNDDIQGALLRSYARHDLLQGNSWTVRDLVASNIAASKTILKGAFRRWLT